MKKIYYSDSVLLFGDDDHSVTDQSIVVDTVEQAKVELFSEIPKRIYLISRSQADLFEEFVSGFETIEAAGGVVHNDLADLLMIFRYGRWDLPKGKLEPGERLPDCALREVEEECAVGGLRLGTFRGTTYHIYDFEDRKVLKKTSWWNMTLSSHTDLKPQQEEGITDVRWVPQHLIGGYLINTYDTIRDLLTSKTYPSE